MALYEVSQRFGWTGPLTDRAVQVCRMFGLTIDRLTARAAAHSCRIEIRPGDIVYLTGPSGAGKSVLLRELERHVPATEGVNLDRIELPGDRTVIDCFESDGRTYQSTEALPGPIAGLPQMKLAWIHASGPSSLRDQALERLDFVADAFRHGASFALIQRDAVAG